MKSKITVLVGLTCLVVTTATLAWDNSYDNNAGDGYQGSSGTTYQYDMGNPADQNRYSVDLDAQRRDQMSLDIGRDRDRGLGQYGGGIYDD